MHWLAVRAQAPRAWCTIRAIRHPHSPPSRRAQSHAISESLRRIVYILKCTLYIVYPPSVCVCVCDHPRMAGRARRVCKFMRHTAAQRPILGARNINQDQSVIDF